MQLLSFIAPHRAALCASTCARHSACPRAGRVSAARRARVGFKGCLKIRTSSKVCSVFSTSKFVLPPTCVGVHDRSVVWSGVRMRGYPPRCITSKSIRLDEFCDACQGRVETVLDRFSHGQVVGTTEHSRRVQVEFTYQQLRKFLHIILFFRQVPFDYSPPHSFVSLLFPAEGMRRASGRGWTVPEQSKRVSTRVKGLWNDTNGLAKRVLNTVHSGSPAQVPGAAGQARGRKREKKRKPQGGPGGAGW